MQQIYDSQFNVINNGTQAPQGHVITYQDIKLATPAAPTFFAGREKITEEAVEKLLCKEPAHLAILGAGGMGKTALALHIIKNADVKNKFQDKIFFVPCEISVDATSLVHAVVQSLGLKVQEGKTGFEILQTYLALSQRPILLVLDNFETPWNGGSRTAVINFIDQLLDCSSLFVILTMRAAYGPGNRHWIKLGGSAGLPQLEIDEAQEIAHNPEELDWILKELDGMPLSIVLIAQLQRQLDLGLNKLMNLWNKHKTAMLTNGSTDESRLTSVAFSINLSLQMIKKKNPECEKLLPVLSYLPNGLPAWNEHLLDFALLYQENNTLKFVLPIQEYIQREYPAEKEHLTQIAGFYVKFVKEFGPNGTNDQNVVERHLDNIVKILRQQLTMGVNDDYLIATISIMAYSKFDPKTVSLIETILENEGLGSRDKTKWMLRKVDMNCWMGQNLEAKEEIQRLLVLLDNALLSTNDKEEWRSICLKKSGDILVLGHRLIEAKKVFLKAKGAFEQMDNHLGQAQCLQRMGDICRAENNFSEARTMLSDAKGVFEQIGDQSGQAQCLQCLGDIFRVENNYSEARTLLSDAKAGFEQIGDHLGQAHCLWSLGDIFRAEQNFCEARPMLSDAKAAFEQIGDHSGQTQCLWSLGEIFRLDHNLSGARTMLSEAQAAFEQIGNQSGQAHCLRSLGNICRAEDNFFEARTMFSDAKAGFEHIGDQLGKARCCQEAYKGLRFIFTLSHDRSSDSLLTDTYIVPTTWFPILTSLSLGPGTSICHLRLSLCSVALLRCLALLLRHTVAPHSRSVASDLFVTLGQDPYCYADCLPLRPSPHKPLPSRLPRSLTAPTAPTVLTPATRLLPTSEKPKIPCPNASANQTVPEVIQLEGFQILPIAADLPPPAQPTPIPSPTKPDNPLFSDEPIDLDNMPVQPGSSSAPPPPMTTEQIIHALAEQVANLTAAVSGRAAAKSSMNKPDLFKGQSSTEARRFLAQFLAWASEQPDLKNNHGKTIKSALGFLTDKAADWATPYLNEYNNGRVPFAGLWPNFVAAFKLCFESVDPEMEARAAIETIHQGKGQSAAEYSQHFKDDASKAAYSRKSDATWS
ncbi:hypothetical protein D9757_015455 [Collybiopsis confluens]|uniref:Novel STAND NTPase 1 domain-containing protein n=1 Tax=Collybiopsis confluens TaxID=2823264 RepID=A0A8H5CFA0_9AGAR|nr:hypothetical protein D9757_015455 [Collybiopsis confluens]